MEFLKRSQDGTQVALSLSEWPKTEAATASPPYPAFTLSATSPAVTPPNSNMNPVMITVTWMEPSMQNRQMTVIVRGYRVIRYYN